jgi:hypothetical protein
MDKFDITLYLSNKSNAPRNPETNITPSYQVGKCKTCKDSVVWSREKVRVHKSKCKHSTAEERALFTKTSSKRSYSANAADQIACVAQIGQFASDFATMGLNEKSDYKALEPHTYWAMFGRKDYPLLAQIALRIFQVPTSSAASERVWKAFSFIHSKRRNRLKAEKVSKLAYIYVNATLLDQHDDRDYMLDSLLDESMLESEAEVGSAEEE